MIMVFCVSSVMLATSALLAPYLQNLAGYPVYTAGWAMAPRGIGTIASMFLAAGSACGWISARSWRSVCWCLGWAL